MRRGGDREFFIWGDWGVRSWGLNPRLGRQLHPQILTPKPQIRIPNSQFPAPNQEKYYLPRFSLADRIITDDARTPTAGTAPAENP